jgi:ankyrin repeat protein
MDFLTQELTLTLSETDDERNNNYNLSTFISEGNIDGLKKIDINTNDYIFGKPLLQLAIEKSNAAIARYLITIGCEVNGKNDTGDSNLKVAMKVESRSIILMLLKNGANINIKDKEGRAPIHQFFFYKYKSRKLDILDLFICYGADLDLKDKHGKSFMDYLKIFGNI